MDDVLYSTGTASYRASVDPRRSDNIYEAAKPWLMIKSVRMWIEAQYGNDWQSTFTDMVTGGTYNNYDDAYRSHATQLQSNKFWANNGCVFCAQTPHPIRFARVSDPPRVISTQVVRRRT